MAFSGVRLPRNLFLVDLPETKIDDGKQVVSVVVDIGLLQLISVGLFPHKNRQQGVLRLRKSFQCVTCLLLQFGGVNFQILLDYLKTIDKTCDYIRVVNLMKIPMSESYLRVL